MIAHSDGSAGGAAIAKLQNACRNGGGAGVVGVVGGQDGGTGAETG